MVTLDLVGPLGPIDPPLSYRPHAALNRGFSFGLVGTGMSSGVIPSTHCLEPWPYVGRARECGCTAQQVSR
jgi:hypothetical protein